MMRWIIKIILFPISLVLSILTAFLTFLLGIGTALLYLLMMFCIFGAIASFMQKEVAIGIEALIIGFLVSPYGIPMVGAAVIAFLQGINEIIKIILFPISLLLSILTAFLTFLLGIGTTILYFLMLMCIVAAIGSFMQKDISLGIEALVLGFLLSPYGIPMVGAAVIAFLQEINEAIKSI